MDKEDPTQGIPDWLQPFTVNLEDLEAHVLAHSSAEKYGDLIIAEHKVLNEGRESRNNHRYAVVVQVLATQWNLCKTKTSQETEKTLRKFLESSQQPKVIHTCNSVEFVKSCEEL